MNSSLEESNIISKDKEKISKFLVHKIIKYSDKKVTEKVQKIEDANKEKISRKAVKKFSYMSLFI